MQKGQVLPVDFIGGGIEICAESDYEKNGKFQTARPKVRLEGLVDKWGNTSPKKFLEMVKAVSGSKTTMAALEELAKLG